MTVTRTTTSPYILALDINGILAARNSANEECAKFFLRNGGIIDATGTHYIFPGVIAFLRRLGQEPVRLAFFSTDAKERTVSLCTQLLERAFGEGGAENVMICSQDNLENCDGSLRKNLTLLLDEEEDLQNVVLIDNKLSCIRPDQAQNLLFVPSSETSKFHDLIRHIYRYDRDGNYLTMLLVNNDPKPYLEARPTVEAISHIQQGTCINLYKVATGGYRVAFKLQGQEEGRIFDLDESRDRELCQRLNSLGDDLFFIYAGPILQQIHAWVEDRGGQTRSLQIWHEANRIYGLAGAYFTAREIAERDGLALKDVLAEMQYVGMQENDELCLRGLYELQKVNPDLRFTDPINYLDTISVPSTEEEDAAIEAARANEYLVV